MLSYFHSISRLRMEEGAGRFVPTDLRLYKIEVNLRENHCEDTLPDVLCESLPDAYSLPSQEWIK